MKIVITGSLGNVAKPLTQQLAAAGHDLTVISSNEARKQDIKSLGATPAIGSITDVDFLTQTFQGADAVFVMTPQPSVRIISWNILSGQEKIMQRL